MSKKSLWSSKKMSSTEGVLVERARSWIDVLCRDEARGLAGYLEAMRRLALRLRMPSGFLAEMIYRPPKRISAGRFLTIAAAYDECIQRQKYREERAAFDPATPLGKILVRAADLISGEDNRSAAED